MKRRRIGVRIESTAGSLLVSSIHAGIYGWAKGSKCCPSWAGLCVHDCPRCVGFLARRRMRKARDAQEALRVEDAYADQKIRTMELATMETEEKLG